MKNIKLLGLGFLFFAACSQPKIQTDTKYLSIDGPARVPAGVVRYCWEEPMVEYQPNGPGVDEEGKWYHPSYLAVREVRQGRWRPCEKVPSEVEGEKLSNER
ncbi:MAG: hypothetical protein KBC84_10955 [Proteobacteria bacterium]|nr:hypothetical protein [Pseudomonadota bacterium]